MKHLRTTNREEDMVVLENRFKVTVSMTIIADSPEDAERVATSIIQEGIIATVDQEEEIYSFDLEDVEPAEVE